MHWARRAVVLAMFAGVLIAARDAAAQPFAYLLGQRDDPGGGNSGIQVITVINAATNAKVTSVAAGLGCQCVAPQSITISRDGAEVYAANEPGNSVTVMSTDTNSVITTLSAAVVGNAPVALVVSSDNARLYVLNGSPGSVTVADRAGRSRLTSVPLGVAQARGMTISPDGTRLYASTYGSNSVKVIDTQALTVIATIPTAALPVGLGIHPSGQFVYAAAFNGNAVSVINALTQTPAGSLAAGQPQSAAVSPDGSRGYVAGNGSGMVVFNPQTNAVTSTIPSPGAASIAFTADSTRAYVASRSTVIAVDAVTNTEITRIGLIESTEGIGAAITVTPPPFTPPAHAPPTGLYASSIVGSEVTLRWVPPLTGTPSGYAVEGGIVPAQVQASLATGSTDPAFRFLAPPGAYYVRVHALTSGGRSTASNEIRIFVNTAAIPSPPTRLLGSIDGSTLTLHWRNTFAGGTPDTSRLDVSGAFTGSLPLGPGESFSFAGVPPGTYTLAVRSVNASGASDPSNPVTLTFPGACSGAPQAPLQLLATRAGSQVTVMWEPPEAGPAPSGYVLRVTGAFVGDVPSRGRILSGNVGPGTYHLAVFAVNSCGQSALSPTHTVTVP